jgi:hypothetical protein
MSRKKKITAKKKKTGWHIRPEKLAYDLSFLEQESVQLNEFKIQLQMLIAEGFPVISLAEPSLGKDAIVRLQESITIKLRHVDSDPPCLLRVGVDFDDQSLAAYLEILNEAAKTPGAAAIILKDTLKLKKRLLDKIRRTDRLIRYLKRKIHRRNFDLRKRLRSVQRSLHITTNDGKDADSDLTGNEFEEGNHFSNIFKFKVEWQEKIIKPKNYSSYNGWRRSSPIWKAEAA